MTDPDAGEPLERSTEGSPASPLAVEGIHAARLRCDTCGRVTVHRIVHWDARSRRSARVRSGLARCRECGGTRPFEVRAEPSTEIDLIESRGAVSERRRMALPSARRIAVGSTLPGIYPPLTVRRIVRPKGDSVPEARLGEVETVWAVPADELGVRVSIVDGARTRPARWVVPPGETIAVGGRGEVDGVPFEVVALRARGRTWRFPETRFSAREVQRVYARRTVSPPAGRRDWRRGRGIPSSRTSSTSRSDRSRSSPGVNKNRASPRRRTASGGAAVQRTSPS